jgi:hypothetical protein
LAVLLRLLRRICTTGAVMLMGVSLTLAQVPVGGDHLHVGPADSYAAIADDGDSHDRADHDHMGTVPENLGFHHCTDILCAPQLTALRIAAVTVERYSSAHFAPAGDQEDLRSTVLERDPPVPKLSV